MAAVFEFFAALKRRTIAVLQSIQTGADNSDKVKIAEAEMLNLNKPRKFQGRESEEIKYDKDFTEVCVFLQQETGESDIEHWTVLKFYAALELIKKQRAK